ncbi:MAG: hypothetical protein HQ530_04085 [Parcubacteria group bacterium]|nr:hypothetical protein [Parcubacteria group bacterium]
MASKGYKKYIRQEKARIRREVGDKEEQTKLIAELYSGLKDKKAAESKNEKA